MAGTLAGAELRRGVVAVGVLLVILVLTGVRSIAASSPDYDIVYVRQPRHGDEINTRWPEVWNPAHAEPGSDLVLLRPDGSEEVLVAAHHGAVTDPCVSFDGEWVYFSYFYDAREEASNRQRSQLPRRGADIYRIHVPSRRLEQLTHREFTPNTGAGRWTKGDPSRVPRYGERVNALGYGILNLGPCPAPGGRVLFTSNRNGFEPPKGFTATTMQLFVMDEDGSNVELIGPMNLSSALHPSMLRDGRFLFSSHEVQGARDRRVWGLWAMWPDGRHWEPVVSAFHSGQSFHFATQLSDGDIVVVDYYNLNNNGFGSLYRLPSEVADGTPRFGSPDAAENPGLRATRVDGNPMTIRMPFMPWGIRSITPFTHGLDNAAPIGADGVTRVGKFTHPSAAPDNDLLAVWSAGPANNLKRPTRLPYVDSGIYLLPGGRPIESPDELIELRNDPEFNEAWPRALVPYREIYGVDEPERYPYLPNDGSAHLDLPPGTPFALLGSSSLTRRDTAPGEGFGHNTFDGLDAFNTSQNEQSSNWRWQGAEAGRYRDEDIYAIRILAMEPNSHRSYGPGRGRHYENHAGERLRILGEIPVRKTDGKGLPLLDPDGRPDTSFLARLPADMPFTFQTLDRWGMVLNMSQTWHQLRPGEVRTDCGGCHAHSQLPLEFGETAAGAPGYPPTDLTTSTPLLSPRGSGGEPALRHERRGMVDVEFVRDVRPILERSCVPCHSVRRRNPPGNLVLDDREPVDGLPGDYYRLAADHKARFGYPPVIRPGTWRQTNASRYVRKFQSRRSLLVWKIFGERLDGWSNEDHPTESIPGVVSSLPPGADPNRADLDFTGSLMPPPDSGVPSLSMEDRMTIVRWIDLGAPIDLTVDGEDNEGLGWYLDDLRPTLTVSWPRPEVHLEPVTEIVIGAFDGYSGLASETLNVSLELGSGRRRQRSDLSGAIEDRGDGVYRVALSEPIVRAERAVVRVEVEDRQGNRSVVERVFSVKPDGASSIALSTAQPGLSTVDERADSRPEKGRDR